MCYSKNLSLLSFIFGITASLSLIKFGNERSKNTNTNIVIGYFCMFVSIMQFIEYIIWSDIECVNGYNKFASIIGPLFNKMQPVIFYLLAYNYIDSNNALPNNILNIIITLYTSYVIIQFISYIESGIMCTTINDQGHLDWYWKYDFNYVLYHLLMLLVCVNYIDNVYIATAIGLSYLLFVMSIFYFNKNIGEIWCLMITGIPLVILLIQRIFDND